MILSNLLSKIAGRRSGRVPSPNSNGRPIAQAIYLYATEKLIVALGVGTLSFGSRIDHKCEDCVRTQVTCILLNSAFKN